jgi:hypothetical protein
MRAYYFGLLGRCWRAASVKGQKAGKDWREEVAGQNDSRTGRNACQRRIAWLEMAL